MEYTYTTCIKIYQPDKMSWDKIIVSHDINNKARETFHCINYGISLEI